VIFVGVEESGCVAWTYRVKNICKFEDFNHVSAIFLPNKSMKKLIFC
jgi:hypothetical protein